MKTCPTSSVDNSLFTIYRSPLVYPSMGRPLQPNAQGGPPVVPQALNRYAATSAGQVGVAQAEAGNAFAAALWHQAPGTAVGLVIDQVTVTSIEKQVDKKAAPTAWGLVEIIHPPTGGFKGLVTRLTQSGLGRSLTRLPGVGNRIAAYYAGRNVRAIERVLLEEGLEGSFAAGEGVAIGAATMRLTAREISYVDKVVTRQVVSKLGSRTALGLSSAAGGLFSAGFQYYNDYDNPYLTGGQKFRRSLVSGGVGGTSSLIGGITGFYLGGPVGFAIGFALGAAGDLWISPLIFKSMRDEPKRYLAPLALQGGGQ